MARKKPDPDGKKPKKGRGKAQPPADLPDRRAIERQLRQLAGDLLATNPADDAPPAKAQALLERAYEERTPERRVQLASEAIALWPDCADAFIFLAEHARRRKAGLHLYEQAVAAGERALGPKTFQEAAGHFWGLLETRPYMRARERLAHALWIDGRREEAVGHLQDMLRLNPNDNQGLRYTLAGFLLFLDRDDDLEQLLRQYPDEGSAAWAYTETLLAFRRHGDTIDARRLLKTAKKTNKHVPAYLLGLKFPPSEQPRYYSPGDETEALEYIGSFMAAWKGTAGAVAWLRENEKKPKNRKAEAQPQGPLALVKAWLNKHLPQNEDVWQADYRQTPNWVNGAGGPTRLWMLLAISRDADQVLAHEVAEEEPTPALLWDTLVKAMRHPAAGKPHRPAELQVLPHAAWEELRPHLEEIGVRLTGAEKLEQMDLVFDDLSEHIGGRREPGLLDAPGVTPEQVAGFYDAAASFFQQAPWKKVGYEAAIRVECYKVMSGPRFAVLMGQSGLTMGLALYEDLTLLQQMWEGEGAGGDEENARETVATSVTFGEEWDIPVADLEAAKRYGWKVARPDAYPGVFHKERGLSMRPPLAPELQLVEACLRAVPDFVNRRRPDDPTPETLTVPTASGPLRLVLSWVVED